MTLTQEQFLWLLRAGLRGCPEGKFPVHPPVLGERVPSWGEIFRLARRQGVLLLVQDGLEVLLESEPGWAQGEKALPPMSLLKLQRFRRKTARTHAALESLMGECVRCLHSDGLHPVILKGEPLSVLYPHPESRSCGDIDLWVPPQEWKRASQRLSEILEPGERNGRHRSYHAANNNVVELHWQPLEWGEPFRQRAFCRYSERELTLHSRPCSLPLSGLPVPVPPGKFNSLFVFAHAFHHFIEGGVGLRQLCDWVKVLEEASISSEADLFSLGSLLRRFALMRPWQIFGFVAVHHLGLEKEKMPFYCPEAEKDAAKVLAMILNEGNFGHYGKGGLGEDPQDDYLTKKQKSLRLGFGRLFAKAGVFPVEVCLYLPRWAVQALRRLRRGE